MSLAARIGAARQLCKLKYLVYSAARQLTYCQLARRQLGILQLGNLAAWQLGNLAAWQLGSLAAWQLGNLASLHLVYSAARHL